jgi:hypothetical protein
MVCSKTCGKQEDFAKSTWAEVENALSGTEAFDLRVSFRQALSFFESSTCFLSQPSSQWIFELDFRGSPGGPWGDRRQCSKSDENVHRRSREGRPECRQNLLGKLQSCFRIHAKSQCPSRHMPYVTQQCGRPVDRTADQSTS